jgi:hypothetical protein
VEEKRIVSPATEQLLESAMALSEDERLQLIDALLAGGDQAAKPFDDAWLAEAQKRSTQIDAGAAVLTPWAEVKQRTAIAGRPTNNRFQCCFCGNSIEPAAPDPVPLGIRLQHGASQEIFAHAACLRQLLHPSIMLHPELWEEE